jgi:tetratricopeptide (TPR) repeat protein
MTAAVLAGAIGLLGISGAWAIGTEPTPTDAAKEKCKAFNKGTRKWKQCMRENGVNVGANDEDLYYVGFVLAKAGDYDGALEYLGYVANQRDPRVLTMTGFAVRKLGRVDEGLGYYRQALAIDPNMVETREYMGEAYLQKGDLGAAKAQLEEIRLRCGTTCEPYTELSAEIADFES